MDMPPGGGMWKLMRLRSAMDMGGVPPALGDIVGPPPGPLVEGEPVVGDRPAILPKDCRASEASGTSKLKTEEEDGRDADIGPPGGRG